ncbi:CPBP family intramembrane glutamic endopeptidase [Pseudoalteromonas sp. SWYJZ12]|uniref:CPBP family intramembrane glutamic endopeptidase n=1 Tax=Pseudoalteromonas sp. SWYJZ12 TaxID=2792067 RepID=UPI0018CFE196|nr:CPBP family intramembrane glutamic endopeptidase [Pseudoalteromonas sp. SWYJZ12]MBH0002987.1 CPBP family intramembrane metalloprotease [Pseudoalteromonas sp. SWYJZ12]
MTFYLLALSIICVFPYCKISIMRQPLWHYLLALSVVSAYFQGYINLYALLLTGLYVVLYYCVLNTKQPIIRATLSTVFIVSSLALALHWVPDFNNLPIVINERITSDAIAFTLYANFDKAMAGLFLCAYFYSNKKTLKADSNKADPLNVKQATLIIITTVLASLTAALMLGLVSFNPKVPDFWLAFMAINLLFTCVAEEALFRGLLQTKLSKIITPTRLAILAPVITAGIFALAHFAGGINYVLVSFIAGLGYGYVFYKTQRLEWAILCHWLVNVCHFFLFTYPMLNKI